VLYALSFSGSNWASLSRTLKQVLPVSYVLEEPCGTGRHRDSHRKVVLSYGAIPGLSGFAMKRRMRAAPITPMSFASGSRTLPPPISSSENEPQRHKPWSLEPQHLPAWSKPTLCAWESRSWQRNRLDEPACLRPARLSAGSGDITSIKAPSWLGIPPPVQSLPKKLELSVRSHHVNISLQHLTASPLPAVWRLLGERVCICLAFSRISFHSFLAQPWTHFVFADTVCDTGRITSSPSRCPRRHAAPV
jgi:hypothetical protein